MDQSPEKESVPQSSWASLVPKSLLDNYNKVLIKRRRKYPIFRHKMDISDMRISMMTHVFTPQRFQAYFSMEDGRMEVKSEYGWTLILDMGPGWKVKQLSCKSVRVSSVHRDKDVTIFLTDGKDVGPLLDILKRPPSPPFVEEESANLPPSAADSPYPPESSSGPDDARALLPSPDLDEVTNWDLHQVTCFMKKLQEPYAGFADAFLEQEVDGKALLVLKPKDVMDVFGMKMGWAAKLCEEIRAAAQDPKSRVMDCGRLPGRGRRGFN